MRRVFIWTCDYCEIQTQKADYGLPDGWVYVKKIGPVPHACPDCVPNLPPGTQTGTQPPTGLHPSAQAALKAYGEEKAK